MAISSGIDIALVERFKGRETDPAFVERLLTDAERDYIFGKRVAWRRLAGRFAAKEAVMKALGTGWDKGIGWRDIEVVNGHDGRPGVVLRSRAAESARDRKVFLSIAYTKEAACALAVICEKV